MCLTTVWINTWNCEQISRINIANLSTIIQLSSNASGSQTNNSLKSDVKKVLIERQYRLRHSKKLYCILLYYDPIFNRSFNDSIEIVPHAQHLYENVMPIVVCRKERRQRSRRRRRRRHLNSFSDNFKII